MLLVCHVEFITHVSLKHKEFIIILSKTSEKNYKINDVFYRLFSYTSQPKIRDF